jgi:uncharacterized membrane protein
MKKIIEYINKEQTSKIMAVLVSFLGLILLVNGVVTSYGLSLLPQEILDGFIGGYMMWDLLIIGFAGAVLGVFIFRVEEGARKALFRILMIGFSAYLGVIGIASLVEQIDTVKYSQKYPDTYSDFVDSL